MCDRTRSACLLVAAAAAFSVGLTAQAGPLHPVALTGTSGPLGPGLGAGVTFSNMVLVKTVHPEFGTTIPSAPCISGTGSLVFGANLTGPGISTNNGSGIWASRGGPALSLVARRGDAVPNMALGYTFGELFTPPQICDANTVVFQSMIIGPDTNPGNDECLFTERSGTLFPLIRQGVTIVPDTGGQGYFGGTDPNGDPWGNNQWVLNRHGDVALRCFIVAPHVGVNDGSGVYTDFGGPLIKHQRAGDTCTTNGITYEFAGCSNPRLNDSGAILTTRLAGDPNPLGLHPCTNRALDASGFGTTGTGPLHQLFIPGLTIAPGVPNQPFGECWSLQHFHVNANGRVAFAAEVGGTGPGVPGGFWSDARFGALQLVALSGATAPGVGTAVFNTNAQFIMGSALSDNNCVALQARLLPGNGVGGGNDTGLWSTRSTTTGAPGNLRLVVREGSPVPANAGPDYEGLNFGEVSQFWVNASGRVAFINLHNDFTNAVWIENADGTLSPVVKEFTVIDVSGNGTDQRLLTNIDVVNINTGTGNSLRTAFNDNGDFAFRLIFADGSQGIFTTAPTPSCAAPVETIPPQSQRAIYGSTIQLSVGFTGTGPVRSQWRHGGVPIQGATTPQLTFNLQSPSDTGQYDCVLTNACGSTTSTAATIVVPQFPCTRDYNGDGDIGTDADISAFFACLSGNCCLACGPADFNGDGDTGTDADIESFFRVLSGGPC
jgi:hypothetical protein